MKTFFSPFGRCCGRALALGLALGGPAVAQAPAWQWGAASQLVVPPRSETNDVSVAVDAAGRSYLTGNFYTSAVGPGSAPAQINFGPTRLVGNVGAASNGFVAQATPAGQWAWALAVRASAGPGSPANAGVADVATAPNGDVYVCGYAYGTQIQVGSANAALDPNSPNLYVARLTAAGLPLWVQTVANSRFGFDNVRLAVNPLTGGAVVAHLFSGALRLGTLPVLLTPGPEKALFVAELNPAGQWVSAVQSTGAATVLGAQTLAAGPQGQLALTLTYEGGPLLLGSLSLPAAAPQTIAFAVADLGPAGPALARPWRWAAGTGGAQVFGVAYRPDGGVWVSGAGQGGTVVGGTRLPGINRAGFVGRLSAAGQWTSVVPTAGSANLTLGPVATDGAGNAVVVGFANSTTPTSSASLTLGPNTITGAVGGFVFFAARLNSAGTWAYAVAYPVATGPPSVSPFYSLADASLDPAGNLLAAGSFTGSLIAGSTTNSSTGDNREAILTRLGGAGVLPTRPAALAPALAVFPNPARSTATLRLPAPAETAATAVLLDALGREVRRYAVPARATETTLDVSGLVPGVYALRCGAAMGRLVVE